MDFLMAPLEGITYSEYRNLQHEMFGGFNEYYAPFVAPDNKGTFKEKFLSQMMNKPDDMVLIPQILTANADAFIATAETLFNLGFSEINLNAGCPSGTVVSKGKGAGMLENTEHLDSFLNKIFSECSCKISVKTRMGINSTAEFQNIIQIYNKYPLSKLIVHARSRTGMYKSIPDISLYSSLTAECRFPVCYNGDINSTVNVENIINSSPHTKAIMIGRAAIKNPAFARDSLTDSALTIAELRNFHDKLLSSYLDSGLSPNFTVDRMKALWTYWGENFPDLKKQLKQMFKCKKIQDYISIASLIFEASAEK